MKTLLYFFILLSFIPFLSHAQDDRAMLQKLMQDDSDDVGAIALYPEQMRGHIFEASSHAEGIARLSDVQKKSNQSFKTLLTPFSKEEQARIWNITRYDGLIDQLVNGGKKEEAALRVIALKFPEEVRDDAVREGKEHFDQLAGIQRINAEFDQNSQSILNGYNQETQNSFRQLLKAPEILSLLNDNMHMTVLLGDLYKRNPGLVRQHFNDLNLDLARKKTRELEEWKEQMKNNPEAEQELQQSAKDYAQENGYREDEYKATDPRIINNYVYVPYPYWCGTPWWMERNYWYPYPHWYHWGFHYWSGRTVWLGTPSWFFLRWHFHHRPHFTHYPHITNCYLDFWGYGHRRYWTRNSHEVRHWIVRNQPELPRDFKENAPQRIDRIRKFGETRTGAVRPGTTTGGERTRSSDAMRPRTQEVPSAGNKGRVFTPDRPATREEPSRRSAPVSPGTQPPATRERTPGPPATRERPAAPPASREPSTRTPATKAPDKPAQQERPRSESVPKLRVAPPRKEAPAARPAPTPSAKSPTPK